MWILKGTLLGLWLLGFGTMAWLYIELYSHLRPNSVVSISFITALTILDPFWWVALAVCLVLGFAIARSWSVPLGLWIALFVTGLIPAGLLTLFLVLVYKLNHISRA